MDVVRAEVVLVLVLFHLRHGVERRQRGGEHVPVFNVKEAEGLLARELKHLGDRRGRRHGHFGTVAGRVAVLRHCFGRRRGCW